MDESLKTFKAAKVETSDYCKVGVRSDAISGNSIICSDPRGLERPRPQHCQDCSLYRVGKRQEWADPPLMPDHLFFQKFDRFIVPSTVSDESFRELASHGKVAMDKN